MKAFRYLVLLFLAIGMTVLLAEDATAATRSKWVYGITLTVTEDYDYGDPWGYYMNVAYVEASQDLYRIQARTKGEEGCNWDWDTEWDNTYGGYWRDWAASSGSAWYATDPWDCLLGHKLKFQAWGIFRHYNPSINETFGIKWVCDLFDPWCTMYYI